MIAVAHTFNEPKLLYPARRDGLIPKGEISMERIRQDELKEHLMETDEEFRRLASAHSNYARKIEALEALPYLSEQERIEEVKLKKLKLHAKDMMAEIMNRHKSQMMM